MSEEPLIAGGGGSGRRYTKKLNKRTGRPYTPTELVAVRGQRASYAFNKLYPWSDWGAMRVKRGSPSSLEMFGPSLKAASAQQRSNRKSLGFTGRGLYTGRGFYKGFGADLGEKIGGVFGLGGLGRALGQAGANYTGFGAYTVGNDTMTSENPIPSFGGGDSQGNSTVTYREYVCDIYGPSNTSFGNQTFELNPGLEATFPFLSQIAQNYEEYEFKQLLFHFRSSIAPIGASGTGQVGEVIMSTNYNAAAPAFTDKQTMLSSALSMSGRVTENQNHGVECDPSKLSMAVGKYVRSGPIGTDEDPKTYDHGKLNVAVAGIPSTYVNQPVGQLWVAYTVELRKPKKFVALGLGISRDSFTNRAVGTSLLSGAMPLLYTDDPSSTSTGLLSAQQNRIGCEVVSAGIGLKATKIVFPASFSGVVKVRLAATGDATSAATGWQWTTAGNVTPVYDIYVGAAGVAPAPNTTWNRGNWSALTSYYRGVSVASNVRTAIWEVHVRVSLATAGLDNTLTFTAVDNPTWAVTSTVLDIEEYNAGFNTRADGADDRVIYLDNSGVNVTAAL